jgi:hypothetical protein
LAYVYSLSGPPIAFHAEWPPFMYFALDERSGPLDLGRVLIARLGRHPVDVALEGVDVRRRVCPEVDVVGMLVHIERQDRNAARRGLAMIARILPAY